MIRTCKVSDMDAVLRIWLDGNREAHGFIDAAYWLSHREEVRAAMAEAEVLIEMEADTVRGFVGMTGDYLSGIFVDRRFRSEGIGRRMLQAVKASRELIYLHVYKKNWRAVEFYLREDFVLASEGVDEETGEAEYVMIWDRTGGRGRVAEERQDWQTGGER